MGNPMHNFTIPEELTRHLKKFFESAPQSTRQVICHDARLGIDVVQVAFGTFATKFPVGAAGNNNVFGDAEGSVMLWPMWAAKSFVVVQNGNCNGSLSSDSVVSENILCFLFDTLTSAHLTVMTGRHQHVSISLSVEFAQPLCVELPFTLTSHLLRVGQRICFLSAEICQKQKGRMTLCARAHHTKAYYAKRPQTDPHLSVSKL